MMIVKERLKISEGRDHTAMTSGSHGRSQCSEMETVEVYCVRGGTLIHTSGHVGTVG